MNTSLQKILLLSLLAFLACHVVHGQYDAYVEKVIESKEADWDAKFWKIVGNKRYAEKYGVDNEGWYQKHEKFRNKAYKAKQEIKSMGFNMNEYAKASFPPPNFKSKEECEKYKEQLLNKMKELNAQKDAYGSFGSNPSSDSYQYNNKSKLAPTIRLTLESQLYGSRYRQCDCSELQSIPTQNSTNEPDYEKEFLNEIARINVEIRNINQLAQQKEIVASFAKAQELCDKIRIMQGQQYFSSTLKKIRKKNPAFTFSITPLAEQVNRKYWIKLRNRANIAYRQAMEAYSGCVYNEGIQQIQKAEITFRFAKTTYDLFNTLGDLFTKKLFGTIGKLAEQAISKDQAMNMVKTVSDDHLAANEDGYDWKSYVGVAGGLISAWDGYVKTYKMYGEYKDQRGLLEANRMSAGSLKKNGRKLLLEFDKYRAYIDAHSSSIDCLNDKLMRIEFDKKTVKAGPASITIWGTGKYDWDGEEFINMIKESGEDLKNQYIYCEDFVKTLQIAINLATQDYMRTEEKLRNCGADPNQIQAQLTYNAENGEWFENESSRLAEEYMKYCGNPENSFPEGVIVVSTDVVPGVEQQDGNPNNPKPWEIEYPDEQTAPNDNKSNPFEGSTSNTNGNKNNGHSSAKNSGNGWSAYATTSQPDQIEMSINRETGSGKTPTGISVGNNETDIWFINENPLGMTHWNLESYSDATSLQNGITQSMNRGLLPMGISFTEQGQLYVLYIQCQISGRSWQLVESQMNLDQVSNDVQSWVNQGFVPCGISIFSGMYYTLMVQLPDASLSNWAIEGYQDNTMEIRQGVEQYIQGGMIPFGYLKEKGVVNILYVGF